MYNIILEHLVEGDKPQRRKTVWNPIRDLDQNTARLIADELAEVMEALGYEAVEPYAGEGPAVPIVRTSVLDGDGWSYLLGVQSRHQGPQRLQWTFMIVTDKTMMHSGQFHHSPFNAHAAAKAAWKNHMSE